MKIIIPEIFKNFKNVVAAVSTKTTNDVNSQFGFNISFKVGDDEKIVLQNRKYFANLIGIDFDKIAFADQIHSDKIIEAKNSGNLGEFDSIYTIKENLFVSVTIADCVPILLYCEEQNISAAIHAGWKGSSEKITTKTILKMIEKYKINPEKIYAFIGPSAGKCCYKVNTDVASKFDKCVVESINNDYYVDLKQSNKNEMEKIGVKNISVSENCTICNLNLHSYRRDKKQSGRMMALIGVKK